MGRFAIFMASLATIAALVDAGCVGGGCGVDRTGEVMGVMKLADVSDRTMDVWWGKFDELWLAHEATLAGDKDILCKPEWKNVLKHLKETKKMILLVDSGLVALKTQLKMIRAILEGAHGSKSGLHCKTTDKTNAICIVLDKLDMEANQKQEKLDEEKAQVDREIARVENHSCDCKWPDFTGDWGECSPDCGPGTQTETRKPLWHKRNAGKPCQDSDATRDQECTNGCCPVHCEWAQWQEWGSCPKECKKEPNFRERIREIKVDGVCIERGGTACVNADANDEKECNIIAVMNKQIADKKVKIAALKALIELYKEKLCEPTPCLNGGKCFMGECHCAEGWTGTHCKERAKIHCAWAEWTAWSPCTEQCGGGFKSRSREEAVEADHGGEKCQGSTIETKECNTDACHVCSQPGWITNGDSCHLVPDGFFSWDEAFQFCKAKGGFLAEIESSDEQTKVSQIFNAEKKAHGTRNFWIGLKRTGRTSFAWLRTGKSPTFTDWGHGEPNGYLNENCGEIHFSYGNWEWNDKTCWSKQHALCKALV